MSLQRFENRQSPRKGAYLIRRWLQMKCGRQSGSSNSAFRRLWVIEFDTELGPIHAITGNWRGHLPGLPNRRMTPIRR